MFFIVVGTHTEHVINEFALDARIDILICQCHTVTNGTDLRRSPQGKIISEIGNSQIMFTLLMDKIQIEYFIGYLYTVCTNMSRVTVRIV
jgi:hypothetical protein